MTAEQVNALQAFIGIGVLSFGAWLEWGPGRACIIGGAALLVCALVETLRRKT